MSHLDNLASVYGSRRYAHDLMQKRNRVLTQPWWVFPGLDQGESALDRAKARAEYLRETPSSKAASARGHALMEEHIRAEQAQQQSDADVFLERARQKVLAGGKSPIRAL